MLVKLALAALAAAAIAECLKQRLRGIDRQLDYLRREWATHVAIEAFHQAAGLPQAACTVTPINKLHTRPTPHAVRGTRDTREDDETWADPGPKSAPSAGSKSS